MIHDLQYIVSYIISRVGYYIKGSKVLSDKDGEEDIVGEALSLCLTAIYKSM
jgi:hypothetical protein